MVFMMHLGFALLESGLTSAKNAINILYKNLMIISIGLLIYAVFRKDPVIILGQSFGLFIYLRNLILIYNKKNEKN